MLEATDVILRQRHLATDTHIVLFQVGSVGDMGFNFAGFENAKLSVLLNYLEKFYDVDFGFVHYIAAQYPVVEPLIEHVTIRLLRDEPERAKRVTGISTFYMPPAVYLSTDPEAARSLGLRLKSYAPTPTDAFGGSSPYGPAEKPAIKELRNHVTPEGYKRPRAFRQTYDLMRDLALSPKLLREYRRRPAGSDTAMSSPGRRSGDSEWTPRTRTVRAFKVESRDCTWFCGTPFL